MAIGVTSTADLLDSLTDAINSVATAFPSDEQDVVPPVDGISLLDVKNDLLLAYLQNLVFLILLRLRNNDDDDDSNTSLHDDVIRKLIDLRVYFERGVRPLEGRLRYQIDKVLRAAEDAERTSGQKNATKKARSQKKVTNGNNGSESSEDESADDEAASIAEDDEETMHRPNVAALVKATQSTKSTSASRPSSGTGAYKPPRITPTSMPTAQSARDRDADIPSRRRKSNLLNEYVEEELSSAPRAQPSIGSNNTILDHGRGGLSTREREKQRERTEYEERNFTRLAAESKAERRKAKGKGDNKRDMFGGEDWTGLGGLGDRIHRSVAGKGGASSVLQRREKRGRDTIDGPRGDGAAIGDTFEKRRKVLDGRAQKRGRK